MDQLGGRCVPAPTRNPTSRVDPEHWRCESCDHNYQVLSSSPVEIGAILGRCVPVPTRDPTSRTDPEHWGCDHNY
ncbi:hypothetical protein EMCRGX_G028425 [Ephydatia muelleri]